MEKPAPFIRIEEHPDFDWGILVIGSVAVPVWIPSAAYITALVVTFLYGVFAPLAVSGLGWASFIPFLWVLGPAVALVVLFFVGGIIWIIVDDIASVNGSSRKES